MRHAVPWILALLPVLASGCGDTAATPEEVATALRQVVAAQARFHQQGSAGAPRYAQTWAALAEQLGDSGLADGALPGYELHLQAEAGGRWSLRATPSDPGMPGFFVDAWGFVRRSETGAADRSAPLESPPGPTDRKSLLASQVVRDLRQIHAHQGLFAMLGGSATRFARSLTELSSAGELQLVAADYAYVIEAPQAEVAWTAWALPLQGGLPLVFIDQAGVLRYELDRAPGPRSPTLP